MIHWDQGLYLENLSSLSQRGICNDCLSQAFMCSSTHWHLGTVIVRCTRTPGRRPGERITVVLFAATGFIDS